MTNLARKFLSTVSAGIVASAPIAMIPPSTVVAGEVCLTTPKDETAPGKHWYYRIERGTKRHCWYLREKGEPFSQEATSRPAGRPVPEVRPDRQTELARSAADAHAELPLPQTPVEADLKISPTTPALDTNLDASGDTDLTPKVPPVAPTQVETPTMRMPASLQILLLGTFGGIAVSWLTGRAIMARMRRRPQHYTRLNPLEWPTVKPTNHTGIPPWLELMPVNSTRRPDPVRDAGSQSLERQRSGLGDNAREIEQLLARFAIQARAEDAGIRGTKGRERRPGLDALMKAVNAKGV